MRPLGAENAATVSSDFLESSLGIADFALSVASVGGAGAASWEIEALDTDIFLSVSAETSWAALEAPCLVEHCFTVTSDTDCSVIGAADAINVVTLDAGPNSSFRKEFADGTFSDADTCLSHKVSVNASVAGLSVAAGQTIDRGVAKNAEIFIFGKIAVLATQKTVGLILFRSEIHRVVALLAHVAGIRAQE